MSRRGLTVVAWVIGLTAVACENVVAPIAHAVFEAGAIDETVRVGVADPIQVEADSPEG